MLWHEKTRGCVYRIAHLGIDIATQVKDYTGYMYAAQYSGHYELKHSLLSLSD